MDFFSVCVCQSAIVAPVHLQLLLQIICSNKICAIAAVPGPHGPWSMALSLLEKSLPKIKCGCVVYKK